MREDINIYESLGLQKNWLLNLGKNRSVFLISLLSVVLAVLVAITLNYFTRSVSLMEAISLSFAISIIVSPVIAWIFVGQFVRLEAAERHMRALATYDSLTGALSRQAFYYDVHHYLDNASYLNDHFVVMILDLDYFKRVNDERGHHVGDQVLKNFGRFLTNHLRSSDLIGRLGGEEFAVLLPQTLPHHAQNIADTLCTKLAAFDILGDDTLYITISIGLVAHTHKTAPGVDLLLQQADQALYQAKQSGRNRAALYDTDSNTSTEA